MYVRFSVARVGPRNIHPAPLSGVSLLHNGPLNQTASTMNRALYAPVLNVELQDVRVFVSLFWRNELVWSGIRCREGHHVRKALLPSVTRLCHEVGNATTPARGRGGAIDRTEAARILAVHVATVDRMIRRGDLIPTRRFATAQLSLDRVEQLALATRPVRRLVAGGDSYWVTRAGAAQILRRSERRVQQLTDAGKLPYDVHETSGWRLYRRAQLEVIGNARRARFGGHGA